MGAQTSAERWGMSSGRRWLLAALLLGIFALAAPPQAGAAIYWGTSDSIGAANLDGSAEYASLPTGALPPGLIAEGVCGLAVDASHLYWKDQVDGSIRRANLEGTESQILVPGSEHEANCGVAVDGAHLYWLDHGGRSIARAKINGSEVEPNFVTGTEYACGIAVDGSHVYWGDLGHGTIGRAQLDGSEVEPSLVSESIDPCGLAVGDGHLYWADIVAHTIGRANLDGTEANKSFVAAAGEPCGVAVAGEHVYWSNGDPGEAGLGRANLDGSSANPRFIPLGAITCGVALDSRVLTPPTSDFSIGKVVPDRRHGTLTIAVTVPSAGAINLGGRGIVWKQLSLPAYERGFVAQAGTVYLRLWLVKGYALRKRLARTGKVHDRFEISFRINPIDFSVWQFSQLTTVKSKAITFLRRRPAAR